MEDITGHDLTDSGTKAFLRFDLLARGIADSDPVQGMDGIARVGNIRMDDVHVDTDVLVDARVTSPDKPVQGLTLSNVTGTCRRAIVLNNVTDAALANIHVSGFDGPFLTATNVTGPGIANIHGPDDTVHP